MWEKNETNIYIKYFSVQIFPSKHHSMWHTEMQKNKQKKTAGIFFTFLTFCCWISVISGENEVFLWPSCTFFFVCFFFLFWLVRRRSIYSTASRSAATRQWQLHPTHTHTRDSFEENKPLKCRYTVNNAFVWGFSTDIILFVWRTRSSASSCHSLLVHSNIAHSM